MNSARITTPPPRHVLEAYGATGEHERLIGGESRSYRVGDLVFKAVLDPREVFWYHRLTQNIALDGIRLAPLACTNSGELVYDGWCATVFVEGTHVPGRWEEKIAISRRFHQALAAFTIRPEFISQAGHPWAVADRMVWGEAELVYGDKLSPHIRRLQAILRPTKHTPQLIHGDMTGNILFHSHLPPAIIDFSPYWRPAEYATAIIITDSIVWENAPDSLLNLLPPSKENNELLVRAAMWRIKTKEELIRQYDSSRSINEVDAYVHLIRLLEQRNKEPGTTSKEVSSAGKKRLQSD
jgi:uncharacterized protein (TIGR02569 family)